MLVQTEWTTSLKRPVSGFSLSTNPQGEREGKERVSTFCMGDGDPAKQGYKEDQGSSRGGGYPSTLMQPRIPEFSAMVSALGNRVGTH